MGEPLWQKTYQGPESQYTFGASQILSLAPRAAGGYLVAGYVTTLDCESIYGCEPAWVAALASDGVVLWQRTWGETEGFDFLAWAIDSDPSGGYVVTGGARRDDAQDAWVAKLGGSGDIEWQRYYGGPESDTARWVEVTSDGGFLLVGRTRSAGAGDYDAWVLKLDGTGAIEWEHTYGGEGDGPGLEHRVPRGSSGPAPPARAAAGLTPDPHARRRRRRTPAGVRSVERPGNPCRILGTSRNLFALDPARFPAGLREAWRISVLRPGAVWHVS